jgi:hypothetical protein
MMKSRNMRWARHMAERHRQVMHTKLWMETMKGRNLLQDISVDGRILKWTLKKDGGRVQTGSIQVTTEASA